MIFRFNLAVVLALAASAAFANSMAVTCTVVVKGSTKFSTTQTPAPTAPQQVTLDGNVLTINR